MPPCSIAVVINPISGGGRADTARARAAQAAAFLAARGGDPGLVFVTERPGHAREIAASAVGRGISTVVAWGGDGTINEVASAVAFSVVSVAIIPGGSGNGLARELGIPFDTEAALDIAYAGREITIDAGEIEGRLFFNVAGVGLDARVAHRFAAGSHRRGFLRYVEMTMRELMAYAPDQLTVATDAASVTGPVMLVAIANGRQYGNGAVIAPKARLDDGLLDIVIVPHRSPFRAALEAPLVFLNRVHLVAGVSMISTSRFRITSTSPLTYHLDGEPIAGTLEIEGLAKPGVLRIKVPTRS